MASYTPIYQKRGEEVVPVITIDDAPSAEASAAGHLVDSNGIASALAALEAKIPSSSELVGGDGISYTKSTGTIAVDLATPTTGDTILGISSAKKLSAFAQLMASTSAHSGKPCIAIAGRNGVPIAGASGILISNGLSIALATEEADNSAILTNDTFLEAGSDGTSKYLRMVDSKGNIMGVNSVVLGEGLSVTDNSKHGIVAVDSSVFVTTKANDQQTVQSYKKFTRNIYAPQVGGGAYVYNTSGTSAAINVYYNYALTVLSPAVPITGTLRVNLSTTTAGAALSDDSDAQCITASLMIPENALGSAVAVTWPENVIWTGGTPPEFDDPVAAQLITFMIYKDADENITVFGTHSVNGYVGDM